MVLHHKILGSGSPLIILHGLFGSSDNWGTLARRWSEERQIILVDQRNHGRSFHVAEMSYELMAQDLLALMDHLGIGHADLLGHSMGGKTVMRAALEAPERVSRLIVADIGPGENVSHHDLILKALLGVPLGEVASRGEAIEYMKQHINNEGVLLFLAKNLYWESKGQLGWRMNLPVLAEKLGEVLAGIGTESYGGDTLFIRGGRSDYIMDEDTMAIQMQFTNSQVRTIADAGHWLHAEQPEEFYTMVSGFLAESAL